MREWRVSRDAAREDVVVNRFSLLVALVFSVGCSVVVSDLNDLESSEEACAPGGNPDEIQALDLSLSMMQPHIGQRLVMNLVDFDRVLRSRVVIEELPASGEISLLIPGIVPREPHTLEFWADVDRDYQPGPSEREHQWIRPLCEDGTVNFEHVFEFESLNDEPPDEFGLDFRAEMPEFARALQSPITIRVERTAPEPVAVGFYALQAGESIPRTNRLLIPGVIDAGSPHRAILRVIRPAGTDLVCTVESTETTNGFEVSFDASTCDGPLP